MQALNQQPTPAAYTAPVNMSMNHAEAINAVVDELKARFSEHDKYIGVNVTDIDGGVTVELEIQLFSATTRGDWQRQCNDIERAMRISAPTLDLMIVVV